MITIVRRAAMAAAAIGVVLSPLAFATAHAAPQESPLAGRLILLDPGHQLGNSNPAFARQMAQKRFNGTTVKGCNTTGTATNSGFPEATFNWRVARILTRMLEREGARVELTRSTNSRDDWGPCVWDRAKQANALDADAMVSIHADGSSPGNRGFFVLAPGLVRGWTEDVVGPGRRLARSMIGGLREAGVTPSNYINRQLMISTNTTGLNFSDVPTVTVELGNMRNAADARLMTSTEGQRQYARGLLEGLRDYFTRD